MIVGPWPAPMAVLIFVLYASFWNSVELICALGFALLNRLTVSSRMPCCGGPVRNQYVAAPAPPPPVADFGPELPHAASAAPAVVPTARLRKFRRDKDLRSTL